MFSSGRPDLIGRTLSHYRITAAIGAGGMGEVFCATDTKLSRDVALKVLPAAMAQDAERLGRFQREARAVAALNHPHIVTIFSVEESEGVHFLTMELVEGQSLDHMISPSGLPIDQIVEIAGALAEALAAAHEKGIVHRDLKPANVMVNSEGRVKVLDFGLAKDVRPSAPDDATVAAGSHTQAGMVMGTPSYMSPEQIAGRPLDHRTDIFSLGVVLHEMATGRKPFEGTSSAELMSAILRDTPTPASEIRPDLPADLARIIRRCLEKDPRHRVQTARDVANEFRDLARQTPQRAPAPSIALHTVPVAGSGAARADEGFWIAVLPFKYAGGNADLTALAEGLTEDIVTGLSRFSYLRVIARSSTLRLAQGAVDIRFAGKELGARYVMEGSLRQAGTRLRLGVQLVDTVSGAHLWAENYERAFSSEALFALQDDLVPRIVSTVADHDGVLPQSMAEVLRRKGEEQLTPHEALLRSFSFFKRFDPEERALATRILENAVRAAPQHADCWAMLSHMYCNEYWIADQPDSLDRGLVTARRAVDVGPSNHLSHWALALALFFKRDLSAFRISAERAIELNRMDGSTVAFMGHLIAYSGDWERGCAIAKAATALNPNHAGWHMLPAFFNSYRKGEYKEALAAALRLNMPGHFQDSALRAAAHAQLGEHEAAQKAAKEALALQPDFAEIARRFYRRWQSPELVESLIDGWRKAGFEIAGGPETSGAQRASNSGAARADEGFWVAVLPFQYTGANADIAALAEGMTEDIVTGLSRFSYLRVIARSATARLAHQPVEAGSAAKELGARYLMEGTIRQAGNKLRIAVQLVDASTGAHLWAETFHHAFDPEALFEIQDELVPRIVSTVADNRGVLAQSMSESLRSRPPDRLTPYEAVLRSFAYLQRLSEEEHALARASLERALEREQGPVPGLADAWAMLSVLYREEYTQGYNLLPDPLGRALAAAQKAMEAAPSNQLASLALATVRYFRREFQAFRSEAERAIALNPIEGHTLAYLGIYVAYSGEWERGCALTERARSLNSNSPGWYWFAHTYNAYRQGDYRAALDFALKMNLPGFWRAHLALAAIYGQLGEIEAARSAVRDLLALRPNFAATARQELEKQWQPDLAEHVLDGLRKAGLDIPAEQPPAPAKTASGAVRSADPRTPSIAVLPFANMSADKDQEYFSDGLAEEIINLLAKIPGLKVIARTSAFAFRGKGLDIRGIADALGVTHVLEGSVRRTETRLRVTGQLIDAADGAHLWSERYDRETSDIFTLQDDIATAIAGALRVKLSPEAMPKRYEPNLAAYEAYLKARYLQAKATPESLELAKQCHERAIKLDPAFALARAEVGFYWVAMTMFGRCPADKALQAARAEAERALQIDPALPDAHALSGYLSAVFEQDWTKAEQYFAFPGARQVGTSITRPLYGWFQYLSGNVAEAIALAQRAIEEDPLDVWSRMNLHAYLQAADREREALEQLRKVLELDPNQAVALVSVAMILADQGNLHEALATARQAYSIGPWLPEATGVLAALLYRNGDDAESQSIAKTLGSGAAPGDARAQAIFHLLCGEVDKGADWAERAIKEGDLAMRTVYIRFVACKQLRASNRWPKIAKMINLPQAAEALARNTSPQQPAREIHPAAGSGAVRADEGFWVAVLPFKHSGPDLAALAEGLTEDIVTGLSRFSYLRVIARSSTTRFAQSAVDVRAAGKELGARYVMEGSLRRAGPKLRLAVQLIDAATGANLWAENFERAFNAEASFELQDDLVPRIVSTVADTQGIMPRSMAELLRMKDPAELTPYEAVLRSFAHFQRVNAEEHLASRAALERAVELQPAYADGWAMLSLICKEEFAHEFNLRPDPLGRAFAAAQRAVEAAPSNHLAYHALAAVQFFLGDRASFRMAAERAIELNPADGFTIAYLGSFIAYAGDWERGCELSARARALNPHHPGWYWFAPCFDAFRKGDYRLALESARKVNIPNFWRTCVAMAACHGHLGQRELGQHAVETLLKLRPKFASEARADLGIYWQPDLVEQLIEGLCKSGLRLTPEGAASSPARHSGVSSVAYDTSSSVHDASGAVRADEGFWVAVLPFKCVGGNTELTALADGLTEDIVTGLSRFSYLRVIARSSTARLAKDAGDIRTAGKEIGARYVMEGTLRRAGTKLRLAVQLVDAVTGAHLWAENFERAFSPDALFELQDDLVPRIVSTIADMNGVLTRSLSDAVRNRAPEDLSPYEAVLRSFAYAARLGAGELAEARNALEVAVHKAPSYGDAWAMLAFLCVQDYGQGYDLQPDALERGFIASQRAVEEAPSSHMGYFALAQALFFRKEWQGSKDAAEKAVALNPFDGNCIAFMGELLVYAGDTARGLELSDRAKQLNPHHPGWYWFANFHHAYHQRDYREALRCALKVNIPGHWGTHAAIAAAAGQLGDRETAQRAIRSLLEIRPDFFTNMTKRMMKWWKPEYVEQINEGWRKAGLEIAPQAEASAPAPVSGASSVVHDVSGAVRAGEGFWVAVLPFKYAGASTDIAALADGLSEEIITGLSHFSYLRVIARGSTLKYANQNTDLRTIGKELGARYVMEGNLRQAGNRLRVAVQLVETTSGAHLWAETYDRAFTPESIFELQDDLVPRIVSTVADQYGVLPRSMSEALRSKSEADLTPHETVLRTFSYFERITPEEHAIVRRILERAVHDAPNEADCWAMLSMIYRGEFAQGFNSQPDPLGRAQAAAQRAVDLAASNHLGWFALASAHFFKKEMGPFRAAAEKSLALNRLDGSTLAYLGLMRAASGDWEAGCAQVEKAIELNPNHPGWYKIAVFANAYRKGDYQAALEAALRMNLPGYFHAHAARAAAYGQLGQREEGQKAVKELLVLRPDFARTARLEYGKWYAPREIEQLVDGLRKAGLDIPDEGQPAPVAPSTSSGMHRAVTGPPSIAVLPFANLSAEKDQEYFSDGLAEEIINLLAHVSGLRVIARTSAFAFRGKEQDIRGIADTLGVNTILQGSVRRSGSRIRVTAQLIDAADSSHLWSQRYDREMTDVFAIQDEIAAAIAEQLKLSLTATPSAEKHTPPVAAYEALLQARHHLYKYSPDSMARAVLCLEKALSIDPEYAAPYASVSMYYCRLAQMGAANAAETLPKARAAAQKALTLDDSMASAHAALGAVCALADYDWSAAGTHFRRALELDPVSPEVIALHVLYLRSVGRLDEALDALKRWLQRDPLSILARNGAAGTLIMMRDFEAAEAMAQETLNLEPNDGYSMFCLVESKLAFKQYQEAIALAEETVRIHGQWIVPLAFLGIAYARGGRPADARRVLVEMHELSAKSGYTHSNAFAAVHVALEEYDTAADLLNQSIDQRELIITNLKVWSLYDDFRSHPRYPALLKRMNL